MAFCLSVAVWLLFSKVLPAGCGDGCVCVSVCVCGAGAGVVAEGVSWQSLYLVLREGLLIFAQPLQDEAGGFGRVISVCPLERVWVEQDSMPDTSSPARRLLLSHRSVDPNPPSLFLYDAVPEQIAVGPFVQLKPCVSRLDVWFEDQRAAEIGFLTISEEIFKAKSLRGQRLQEFLSLVS